MLQLEMLMMLTWMFLIGTSTIVTLKIRQKLFRISRFCQPCEPRTCSMSNGIGELVMRDTDADSTVGTLITSLFHSCKLLLYS